jgi:hypothetical protein
MVSFLVVSFDYGFVISGFDYPVFSLLGVSLKVILFNHGFVTSGFD